MAKVINSMSSLQSVLENACATAINTACNRLLGKLQELIYSEFYDQFEPEKYVRTWQFASSALTKMLTNLCGQIYMEPSMMSYSGGWSGKIQLEAANIGSHGGIIVSGRYWDEFIKYCESNAANILKEELRKCGISVS